MTDIPKPEVNDTSWDDWATDEEAMSDKIAALPVVVAAVTTGGTAAANSTALNAAMTAAGTGGTVLIPPGTFAHNGFTIPATGKIAIRGCGRGITILNNTHATNASVTAIGAGGGSYCIDWTLSDLTLTASAVRAAQVGITCHLAVRFRVSDVTVSQHGVGIRNNASWECTYDTVSAYQCTLGWDFSAVITTVSCPVTVVNGSAVVCGTGMQSVGSVEDLSWHGGDFAGCTVAGMVLTGDATRAINVTGVNFEGIGGDDLVVGDGSSGPTSINFRGCRFSRPSLVGGSRSVNIVRGGPVHLDGCYWANVTTAIAHSGNSAALTVTSPSVFNATTFLDSGGVTAAAGDLVVTTPRKIMSLSPLGFPAAQSKAWGDTGTVGPFSLTFTVTLDSFSSTVGTLAIGGAQFNNSVNRVAYLGTLFLSAKDNNADAWGAYVTAAGTPLGLASGPTVAVTGSGATRTLTVTFTASNNDVYGGSCAVMLARR